MSDGAKESVKLLPCPFCGTEAQIICEADFVSVACPHYYCNFSQIALRNKDRAIARWNTRATPLAAPAQSNGDEETLLERLDDQGLYSKAERIQMIKDAATEIRNLNAQLATAEATYLQFCKKHDEKMVKAIKALEPFSEVLTRLSKAHLNGGPDHEEVLIEIGKLRAADSALKEIT